MNGDQNKDEKQERHCALCLLVLSPAMVKLCGGCNRRAYCSQQCQVNDWSQSKGGQGHKNWCKLICGEEDLDWMVTSVPGKGLGLIAKRKIPAKFRIIVDAIRKHTDPGIKDLLPLNGTVKDKLILNGFGSGDNTDDSVFCLRIARANHECDANASHFQDETFNAKVLFAERDIEIGEEICISYQAINDYSTNLSPKAARFVLQAKWGINCKEDCFCQNKEIEKMVATCRKLDNEIYELGLKGNVVGALQKVEELLQNQAFIHSSFISTQRTLYDGFQTAIMKRKTLNQADGYIRKVHDIISAIISPKSAECLDSEKWIKKPSLHPNYLMFD